MRPEAGSPVTSVGAKGSLVKANSPPEKVNEERENGRRSTSHSHSRSNSMMNGTKTSTSPVA